MRPLRTAFFIVLCVCSARSVRADMPNPPDPANPLDTLETSGGGGQQVGDGTTNNTSTARTDPSGTRTPSDTAQNPAPQPLPQPHQPPQQTVDAKPLPQTPDPQAAQQHQQAALDAYQKGDAQTAQREIQLALQNDPNDPRLKSIADIIIPHVLTPFNEKSLKARAGNLMEDRDPGALAEGGGQAAILASPLALGAAAPRQALTAGANPIDEYLKRDPAKDAVTKMKLRDYAGAEDALTLELARNPADWLAYRTRALARRHLKKLPQSFDDATRALQLNPHDGWSRDIRSATLVDMGRPQEALDDANEALKLNRDDANAFAARGEALEKLGRGDDALAALKRAAELDSQYAELFRLALRRREGDPPGRAMLAYAAASFATILLIAALVLGRRSATARATTRKAMRAADQVAIPKGFEVVRRLGEGGMGIVYEAVDKGLERRVALKKMRDEIAADPRERRRFLKEARTVAALHHPNIVEIYSIVDEGPDLFLVFELLHGETLAQLMGGRTLDARKAAALATQIAAALDHAHARGVIHQDLKPSNILIAADNAKVMDFGIARRPQQTMSTTSRREIAGTPAYMAPEQEQGSPLAASDVYSLGVCVYEMLSGKTPFAGGGIMQKLTPDYPRLSAWGHPPALDDVLAKALAPDPAKRFASAGELARALKQSLG